MTRTLQVQTELSWLHEVIQYNDCADADVKECKGSEVLLGALEALFKLSPNVQRFSTVDKLLTECRLSETTLDGANSTPNLSFAPHTARVGCAKIFKCIVDHCGGGALSVLQSASDHLQEMRVRKTDVQPLLLRVLLVLFAVLNTPQKQEFADYLIKAVKESSAKRRASKFTRTKRLKVYVTGDGYDGSLAPDEKAYTSLNHPTPEALAPFLHMKSNSDVFLLTTNVSAIYEYLDGYEEALADRFAEVYGNLFTGVSSQYQIEGNENVHGAKEKLAGFIDHHRRTATSVQIRVYFLGIGFTRNGVGLEAVLSPHAKLYTRASILNRDHVDTRGLSVCLDFMGGKECQAQVTQQQASVDYRQIVRGVLRWNLPALPCAAECERIRLSRLVRCIGPTDLNETPDNVLRGVLKHIESEKVQRGMLSSEKN